MTDSPTVGLAWLGVKIAPADADGMRITSDSGAGKFEVALTSGRAAVPTIVPCDIAWQLDALEYRTRCDIPPQSPAGTWSLSARLDSTEIHSREVVMQCPAGSFDDGLKERCQACPDGTKCDRAGFTNTTLPLKNGYWREGSDTDTLRECPIASGCTFGACAEGHHGIMCGLCKKGHYYHRIADKCKLCVSMTRRIINCLVAAVVAVLVMIASRSLLPVFVSHLPRCWPAGVRLFDMGKFKVRCMPPPPSPLSIRPCRA